MFDKARQLFTNRRSRPAWDIKAPRLKKIFILNTAQEVESTHNGKMQWT